MKKFVAISLMISAVVIGINYIYFYINMNECLENPLSYGAKQYSNLYNEKFVGVGSFMLKGESPIIYFDSEGTSVDNTYNNSTFDFVLNSSNNINKKGRKTT